jgi:transportin-1
LSSVAVALGPGFSRFAVAVFKHTHNLIEQVLLQDQQYQQGAILDPPDKEFLVAALDLMSGLVQGLGDDLSPLIGGTEPKLAQMLTLCLRVVSFTHCTNGRMKSMMSVNLDSLSLVIWL